MTQFSYVIKDELGIHARPAGLFINAAKGYESSISIESKGKKVSATSLIAVMSLCVKNGDEITVYAEGPDEEKAACELKELFENNL